jgi:predicted enzyme related to lactoylglutathione lyase
VLSREDVDFAGILQMNEQWAGLAPHWMVYFQVADMDAAVRAVQDAGGAVQHGPFDSGHGRLAVVADPAGAIFSLQEPAR